MKKIIISALFLVLFSSVVAADYGMMGSGYNTIGGMFGAGIGLIYFALGAFIFSVIFWLTYNWLVKDKKKKR